MNEEFDLLTKQYTLLRKQAFNLIEEVCFTYLSNIYNTRFDKNTVIIFKNNKGEIPITGIGLGLNLENLTLTHVLTHFKPNLITEVLSGSIDRFGIIDIIDELIKWFKTYCEQISKKKLAVSIVNIDSLYNKKAPDGAVTIIRKANTRT